MPLGGDTEESSFCPRGIPVPRGRDHPGRISKCPSEGGRGDSSPGSLSFLSRQVQRKQKCGGRGLLGPPSPASESPPASPRRSSGRSQPAQGVHRKDPAHRLVAEVRSIPFLRGSLPVASGVHPGFLPSQVPSEWRKQPPPPSQENSFLPHLADLQVGGTDPSELTTRPVGGHRPGEEPAVTPGKDTNLG